MSKNTNKNNYITLEADWLFDISIVKTIIMDIWYIVFAQWIKYCYVLKNYILFLNSTVRELHLQNVKQSGYLLCTLGI